MEDDSPEVRKLSFHGGKGRIVIFPGTGAGKSNEVMTRMAAVVHRGSTFRLIDPHDDVSRLIRQRLSDGT